MRVSDVLRSKGSEVFTVRPETTVAEFLDILVTRRIGACVLSPDGALVVGIVSERDIALGLASRGASVLDAPVSELATADVQTAAMDTTLDELMRVMTERRVRHVPILVDGVLSGLISIGDVVKHRMDELESEREHLVNYISSAG
ncbi:MAG: CBS domain-containing protein [Sporichthyaceae bacterium]